MNECADGDITENLLKNLIRKKSQLSLDTYGNYNSWMNVWISKATFKWVLIQIKKKKKKT